jgi:catalase
MRATRVLFSFTLLAACARESERAGEYRRDTATVETVNTALERAYGVHPGQRRNHAKGVCALGTFDGEAAMSAYSRSTLFGDQSIPVVARFSIGGGNPNVPDTDRGVRGMSLEFRLPGGGLHHMTMINTPMFFTSAPQGFLDKFRALAIDSATGKPNPAAMQEFLASHPEAAGQTSYLAAHNPPPSYANAPFFGVHTFKFVNQKSETTLVRFRFVPRDSVRHLTDAELSSKPANFLQQALVDRLKRGPARWDMFVAIGEPGDPQDDPTELWPASRREVKAGTLSLTSVSPNQATAGCTDINYDPLVMADGIAPTNDPVLLFRSPSYAQSHLLRIEGK